MPQGRQAPQYDPNAILTPVATSVDTYTGPSSSNPMMQLAGALRDLNPMLDNYVAQEKKIRDTTDFNEGQTSYLKAKSNLKDAVNNGTIQAGFSPAFKRGFEQSQLRMLGLDYDQQLREEFAKSPAATSDDPQAFHGFLADFTSQFMEKNNVQKDFHPLDVGEAFTPGVQAAQHSLATFHVEQRAKTIEDDWAANSQNEISTTMDNGVANKFTPEQLGAAVSGVITKQLANGWHDKSDFNKKVVDLTFAKAVGTGNVALLDVLKHIPAGPGGTLGNTSYARDKALEGQQRISNMQRDDVRWDWAQQEHGYSLENHAWAQQEHARSMQDWNQGQSSGALLRALVSKTITDPTSVTDEEVKKLVSLDKDGSAARTYLSFKHSYLDGKSAGADDPKTVTNLYTKMYDNPSSFNPKEVIDANAGGRVSLRTMTGMLDDARRAAEGGGSPMLHDPVYTTLLNGVTKAFTGNEETYGDNVATVALVTERRTAFQRHAITFLAQHKDNPDANAFYDEMEKYQKRLVGDLLKAQAAPAKPQAKGVPSNPYAQPGMGH